MLYFASDYMEGAHEKVLEKLLETNMEHLSGYGMDMYSESAKEKIKTLCGCENADVYFLVGGTQTNAIVIDALLNAYEGVVCADNGHIYTHEAGAVEFTGHKVLALPGECGKLKADTLKEYLETFYADENHEHMRFFREWYTYHIPQSMERYIARQNWSSWLRFVTPTKYLCIWMGQDLVMDL